MTDRSYVMSGSLSDFSIGEVLNVVGLSRQHTLVELHEANGNLRAALHLKAGHLVRPTSDKRDPKGLLTKALEADASCSFHVYRLDDQTRYRDAGALATLLEEAAPPTAAVTDAVATAAAAPTAPAATAGAPGTGVSMAIASPKGGVGKTTIALNLGISLARRGLQVIVIDADVNGDLLSLVDARGSAERGSYDLLNDPADTEATLRRTVIESLRILPAGGRELPAAAFTGTDPAGWRRLVAHALTLADVVLVDCPAGMTHTTLQVLQSVSHVLGVCQAETIASRSFEMFSQSLSTPGLESLEVAGVVVNMLRKDAASKGAYEQVASSDAAPWLLGTTIRHGAAFDAAAAAGTPVHLHGTDASRSVAWDFDTLAAELVLRVPLAPEPVAPGRFLV